MTEDDKEFVDVVLWITIDVKPPQLYAGTQQRAITSRRISRSVETKLFDSLQFDLPSVIGRQRRRRKLLFEPAAFVEVSLHEATTEKTGSCPSSSTTEPRSDVLFLDPGAGFSQHGAAMMLQGTLFGYCVVDSPTLLKFVLPAQTQLAARIALFLRAVLHSSCGPRTAGRREVQAKVRVGINGYGYPYVVHHRLQLFLDSTATPVS